MRPKGKISRLRPKQKSLAARLKKAKNRLRPTLSDLGRTFAITLICALIIKFLGM